MKKFFKENWFYVIIFILITLLSYFFVYAGDDWFWASSEAVALLKNGFKHYNGRYLSNIVIMLISRSIVLKCLFYGLFTTLLLYFIQHIVNKKDLKISYIFLILFFLIDIKILNQGYVWASGFVNFFLTSVFLIYIIKLNSDDKFKDINFFISLLFGFLSSLCLENVSLLLIFINVLLFIYSRVIKIKKYNIGFFIGNILGTILMFVNILIFKSEVGERELHFKGIVDTFCNNIVPNYFGKSMLIVLLFVSLILILVIRNRKKLSKLNIISFSIISILYLFFNYLSSINLGFNNILNSVILIIYFVYSFMILIKICDSKLQYRVVGYYIMKFGYIAPLIFVDSLGPRLLLFPSILDIILILEIINILFSTKKFNKLFLIVTSISLIMQFIIFGIAYNKASNSFKIINNNLENNVVNTILSMKDFVNQYHFFYLPYDKYFQKYYIEFYDINTDLDEFEVHLGD